MGAIKLSFDPVVIVAEAETAEAFKWKNREYKLSDLFEKLSRRLRSGETQAEYMALHDSPDKGDQAKAKAIKDRAGGFVGAELGKSGRRQIKNIIGRSLLTWDFDSGKVKPFLLPGICCAAYSTHSYTPDNPRFRIIAPLSRTVTAQEYVRLSRLYVWDVSEFLGMEPGDIFTDDTTHSPEHLQYWPSAPRDAEVFFDWQDGNPVDVDKILDIDREPYYPPKKPGGGTAVQFEQGEKVPVGQRFFYLITVLGDLVRQLARNSTDDQILKLLWVKAHDECEGDIDGEDFDAFCSKYRPAVEKFRAALSNDNYDFKAAVGDYYKIHPGEDLPKRSNGQPDWDAVRTEVEVARLQGAIPETDKQPEEVREPQLTYKKDKQGHQTSPESTINNFVECLLYDSELGGCIRFNEFSMRTELVPNMPWRRYSDELDDSDTAFLRALIERKYGLKGGDPFFAAVDIAARENSYHPIRDILNGLEWDGVDRIGKLFPEFLGALPSDYNREVERLLFSGAVSRIFHPGIKFDLTPVLISSSQGIGKSSLCRYLAIKDKWFSDSVGSFSGKEAQGKLSGIWIVELGEGLAFKRSENELTKRFLSATVDRYRPAYGRYEANYFRQNVFIATTNQHEALPNDSSGNRRFLPVICEEVKRPPVPQREKECREFILQEYAQIMKLFREGECKLTVSSSLLDQAKKAQEEASPEDPRKNAIIGYLEKHRGEYKGGIICVRDVFYSALGHNPLFEPEIKQSDSREIARILDSIPGLRRRGTMRFKVWGGSPQKAWEMPESWEPISAEVPFR